MGIHPEFKPTDVGDAVDKIRKALGHMFPLNSVRIVSGDEIAIEDNDGNDWQIIVKEPGS
jgi:hypothetical protein